MSPKSGPAWISGQSWTGGYQTSRRGHVNSDLRVSDAERADVADRLSKHYGDGRLDQAEFNERMERAMAAKTHGDFAGLFSDLPDLTEPGAKPSVPAQVNRPSSRSPMSRLVLIIVIIVAAAVIGQALIHSFFPWLLVALVGFLWLRHHESNHHRA